jgi:hypothetical protein
MNEDRNILMILGIVAIVAIFGLSMTIITQRENSSGYVSKVAEEQVSQQLSTSSKIPFDTSEFFDQTRKDASAKEMTKTLIQKGLAYKNSGGELKESIEDQIVEDAKARKEVMKQLALEDPKQFLALSVPLDIRNSLPEKAKPYVEKEQTITGMLEVIHVDEITDDGHNDHTHSKDRFDYFVYDSSNRRIRIRMLDDSLMKAETGSRVRFKGMGFENDDILAAESTTNLEVLASGTLGNPEGYRNFALIFVNYENKQSTVDIAKVKSDIFTSSTSLNAYIQEVSFYKLGMKGYYNQDGDIYVVTIPYNNTNCSSMYSKWGQAAEVAATSQGYSSTNYNNVAFVFLSASGCGWGGLGSVGGKYTWNNGFSRSVITHELGHNLGFWHSSSIVCQYGSQTVSISNNCTLYEYGDVYDVMGSSASMKHYNTYWKRKISWIGASGVINVSVNGDYTITPMETLNSMPQVLSVKRPGRTDYYFVEYRRPIGFDANIQTEDVNGVMIRLVGTGSSNTRFLDASPSSSGSYFRSLTLNNVFQDTISGVTMQLLSYDNASATVRVTYGPAECIRSAPAVTVSPSSNWAYPGYNRTYVVTVSNMDTTTCNSSIITTSISNTDSGITLNPTTNSATISSGASSTFSFTVSTTENTLAKTYTIPVVSTNTKSGLKGTTNVVLDVVAPDYDAPVLTITSPADGSTISTKGSMTISATATDASGIYDLVIYFDNVFIKRCSSGSTGTSATCSAKYKFTASKSGSGPHTILVRAMDNSPKQNYVEKTTTVYG